MEYCLSKKNFSGSEIMKELNLSLNEWLFYRNFLENNSFIKHNEDMGLWSFLGRREVIKGDRE